MSKFDLSIHLLILFLKQLSRDWAGIFLVSSGAEIRPLSQWDLGDFFPNLKKKFPISKKKKKKKIKIFFFFFFLRIFIQSPHTHTHTQAT